MRTRIIKFIVIIQGILLAAHGFVYETWMAFRGSPDPPGITGLQAAMGVLSVSFVAASLVAFRYSNLGVKLFYRIAAVWLGTLNFLVMAALLCWGIYLVSWGFSFAADRPALVATLYALAALTSLYGAINARRVRVKRIMVKLANLPPSWRGRTAADRRRAE